MLKAYPRDLAYIHDAGHGDFARRSAPGLLEILRSNGVMKGLVIDLGCGSGIWARELIHAGYEVLGVDISAAMIQLARRKAPQATFIHASFFDAKFPACEAVTSIGECFNYLFDQRNSMRALAQLLSRIYRALRPGGVLVFDILEPGQVREPSPVLTCREGKDWAVLVKKEEDPKRNLLTRHITSFRKVGALYRRSEELHRVRLYRSQEIISMLRRVGFKVRWLRGYGELRFTRAHVGFFARKP
jgi:SAM-dependent methyltransferase